jgi:hypothetical protein
MPSYPTQEHDRCVMMIMTSHYAHERYANGGGGQPKSFFNEVMRSLRKQAGGNTSTGSLSGKIAGGRSTFGRGRNA